MRYWFLHEKYMFKKNHGIIIQFQLPQIISRIAINYSLDNIRDSKKSFPVTSREKI